MFNNHHDMINYYRYQNKGYGKTPKWYLTKAKTVKTTAKDGMDIQIIAIVIPKR